MALKAPTDRLHPRGLISIGKLIYSMSVSLDGFVESPGRSLDWVQVDEELHTFFNDQSREISATQDPHLRLGRRLPPLRDSRRIVGKRDSTGFPPDASRVVEPLLRAVGHPFRAGTLR
jgi:hypothetical protein